MNVLAQENALKGETKFCGNFTQYRSSIYFLRLIYAKHFSFYTIYKCDAAYCVSLSE